MALVDPLADRLAARIATEGSIGFDEFVGAALYDAEGGFYASGSGAAGRRDGDFLTSPEVGPLFGAVVARALGEWWEVLGRPRPFAVIEAAAGRGALAAAVAAADPPWFEDLEWVLVERSPRLRVAQAELLDLGRPASPFRQAAGLAGVGAALGRETPLVGVVLANELLDNLPVRLARRLGDRWIELRVGLGGDAAFRFERARAPLEPEASARLDALAPDVPDGAIVPLADAARRWVRSAHTLLDRGRMAVVDYGASTASLAARPSGEWLRTYRSHDRAGDPLADPGSKDITCEVPVDQLDDPRPLTDDAQAEWLRRHGIEALVDEGRRVWSERAHIGDLAALRARSRVREADALLDPGGLGGFRVLTWSVGERPGTG